MTYIPIKSATDNMGTSTAPAPTFGFDWLTFDDREWAERAMIHQETIRDTMAESTTLAVPTTTKPTTFDPTFPVTMALPPTQVLFAPPQPALIDEPPPLLACPSAVQEVRIPTVPAPVQAAPIVPAAAVIDPGVRCSTRATKGVFQKPRYIDEVFISATTAVLDSARHAAQLASIAELFTCSDTGVVNITDPRVYASKTPGSDCLRFNKQ